MSTDAVDTTSGALVVTGLTAEPLDPASLADQVRRDDCGGVVVFEGTVRSPNQGHEVLALEYEAWEDRTPAQLERIAHEVVEAHGLGAALAVHRTGRVEVGAPAVVVVAVAAHRDAAFAGARDLIDRVKAEAWIWKKELRADGEVWVDAC
jgi:molybdopterin synthase catalytic subunit